MRHYTKNNGEEVVLTEGEEKIVRALDRLNNLWIKYGGNLTLFNGDSLRYGYVDYNSEITTFPGIKGEGGDGGDVFD